MIPLKRIGYSSRIEYVVMVMLFSYSVSDVQNNKLELNHYIQSPVVDPRPAQEMNGTQSVNERRRSYQTSSNTGAKTISSWT